MDIRSTLAQLEIPFSEGGAHANVRSGFIGTECPLCTPGKSGGRKLGINPTTLFASCWTCGPQRIGTVLAELSGRPLSHVLSLLPGRLDPRARPAEKPTGRYAPPFPVSPLDAAHRRYLTSRGIDPDMAADVWGVGGIGADGGDYRWRLFLPVQHNGRPASWTTRAVGNHPRRYWAANPDQEAKPLKSMLYGEQHCRHGIVVVEGPLDAIVGGPGFAATFGTSYTPAQVARIARFPVRCICYDNEVAAQRTARKLAAQLEVFPGRTVVARVSGPDPATSPPEELCELRERFLI